MGQVVTGCPTCQSVVILSESEDVNCTSCKSGPFKILRNEKGFRISVPARAE